VRQLSKADAKGAQRAGWVSEAYWTDTLARLGYNRPRFFEEGLNSMCSRSASSLGARNQIAAVLLVVAGAFGLTSLPSPARADDEAMEQARKHYQQGKQSFDLGKWDAAIAEFEEAYKLHADANFLFNLAQAYRRKGRSATRA